MQEVESKNSWLLNKGEFLFMGQTILPLFSLPNYKKLKKIKLHLLEWFNKLIDIQGKSFLNKRASVKAQRNENDRNYKGSRVKDFEVFEVTGILEV